MSLDRTVAHFVTHRRKLVVLITALVTVASALVIVFGVRFNSDVLDLFPAHFDSVRVWKISNREFSQGRALTFALHDEAGEVDLDEFTLSLIHISEPTRQ